MAIDTLIIGAGGHGKVVLDALQCQGTHRVVGFVDADPQLHGQAIAGVPVLGGPNQLMKLRQQKIRGLIVAIGDNRVRLRYAAEAEAAGFELVSAVHPRAVVAASAVVGRNVLVAAGAVVCADATLGDSSIVNTSAVVDHECGVGPGAHIAPGAVLAGRVKVGIGAFVGLGSRVLPCLSVGDRAIVGAGAVVLRDVPSDVTVVGVPARPLPTKI